MPSFTDEGMHDRNKETFKPLRHEIKPALQHIVVDF